jgi:hypothetical protein
MTYYAVNMIPIVDTAIDIIKSIWQAVDWNMTVHILWISLYFEVSSVCVNDLIREKQFTCSYWEKIQSLCIYLFSLMISYLKGSVAN